MSDDSIDVSIPVPETDSGDSPGVVVVDTGDSDNGSDAVTDAVIDHEGRLAEMQAEIERLNGELMEARASASVAETVAEEAAETAEEAVEVVQEAVEEAAEAEVEVIESDESPNKPHFVHRSFRDLVGRS